MDVSKILAELREERAQIEEAISSLERLAHGRGKRRGRPPAWMSEAPAKRRGRPPGSKNKVIAATAAAATQRRGSRIEKPAPGKRLPGAFEFIAAARPTPVSPSRLPSSVPDHRQVQEIPPTLPPKRARQRRRAFSMGFPSIATIKSPPIQIG